MSKLLMHMLMDTKENIRNDIYIRYLGLKGLSRSYIIITMVNHILSLLNDFHCVLLLQSLSR